MNDRGPRKMFFILMIIVLSFQNIHSQSINSVTPGEFLIEPPTLICAGFEWRITGDDNHNAQVTVHYRQKGESKWNEGLPLFRFQHEKVFYPNLEVDYTAPNMFSGSLFDLKQGTEYECRFVLSDPDGVNGQAEKFVTIKTKSVPKVFKGGHVRHVYPVNYKGKKEEPHYEDLLEAYYGKGQGYWGSAQVEPGDIILIHAGLYRADYHGYSSNLNLDFYGTYVLSKDGTPDKPIVIKAAGDGPVVFDGDGTHKLFDVTSADYTFFEGLNIINADVAIYAGLRHVIGCKGLVVRDCVLENVGVGIMAQYVGSSDFYIADNVILGRDNQRRVHGWTGRWLEYGIPSELRSFIGIDINGQGHTVCHNYVAYFHDAIDVTQQGAPESDDLNQKAVSIDFYNNDIFLMADDFFEADCGVHNIRIFRNRCVNSAHCGISAQPVYGGPAYFFRNILYNLPSGAALKFNIRPTGLLVYNNTICGEWTSGGFSNVCMRNNLFLGSDLPNRPVMGASTYTSYTSFDYNGYRPNKTCEYQFYWRSPDAGTLRDYELKNAKGHKFKTLAEFQQTTDQERHSILVDYDIFRNVQKPDPDVPGQVYPTESLDFSLKKGSVAIDAGCMLPNINDVFTGRSPDLGALEYGADLPVYGPRPRKQQ